MDNIQKRADDQAWDKKVNRRISDINDATEKGLSGEALAASPWLAYGPERRPAIRRRREWRGG